MSTLVSASDIATAAGVGRAAVSNWQKRHEFPKPVAIVAGGQIKVWEWGDVETWLAFRNAAKVTRKDLRILKLREQLAQLESESN